MLLFPAEPFTGQVPDETYGPEVEASRGLGLDHALIDFEALLDGNLKKRCGGSRA